MTGVAAHTSSTKADQLVELPKFLPSFREKGRSNNARLEQLFHSARGYLNRELTVPCGVALDRAYINPKVTPVLQQVIDDHCRTIILPYQRVRLSSSTAGTVKTLASPYECGRVLEADRKIMLEGQERVLTVKGVGCTSFYRSTGADNQWMREIHREFTYRYKKQLAQFPIRGTRGLMSSEAARKQQIGAERVHTLGLDAEQVLAIVPITKIVGPGGDLNSIETLKQWGIIDSNIEPVLMFRAVRTNVRLLDIIMLEQLGAAHAITPLLEAHQREAAQLLGRSRLSLPAYCEWLAETIVAQQLPLIAQGYILSTRRWEDFARNVSLLGEHLDLEYFERVLPTNNPSSFFEQLTEYAGVLQRSMLLVLDAIRTHSGNSARGSFLADCFSRHMINAVRSEQYEATYQQLKDACSMEYESLRSFRDFQHAGLKAFASPFVNYTLYVRNQRYLTAARSVKRRFSDL